MAFLEEISSKISEMMQSSPLADVEKNVNALIKGAFTKMELVTREEFDVQTDVLLESRKQLIALEAKLALLEQAANQS